MKFSTHTLYGLEAILVLAGRYGEGSMSVATIARKQGISLAYLEQILNALKKKGLVRSVRGPQGGYILARKPSEITLKTLFRALVAENTSALGKSRKPAAPGQDGAAHGTQPGEASAASAIFWNLFQASIDEGLGRLTLKELVDKARRLLKVKPHSPYTFHI